MNNIGKLGEIRTGQYLEKMGYRIIRFNYHSRYGEIDIICENDKYTVFVEVKTRKNFSFSKAIEAVDKTKRAKILRTAFVYLSENEVKQPRFDVAEVLADKKGGYKIFYHENAFDAEEFCEIF